MPPVISRSTIGIDLHVHTPASRDYRGALDDSEFVRIATEASGSSRPNSHHNQSTSKLPSVSCIAFTDHNSIDGFIRFCRILSEKQQALDTIKSMEEARDVAIKLQGEIQAMRAVHVLMGVEVSCNPGIHMLVIFKEDVQPSAVMDLLEYCYGEPYSTLAGNPAFVTKCSITEFLDVVGDRFGDSAFVVAPHIDSDSGLIQGLKEYGKARMGVVAHSALLALSFIKEETRDYLRHLARQPDYSRLEKLALIQSSDFHGVEGATVGQPRSELAVLEGRISYDTVRSALVDAGDIKCSVDSAKDEYQQFIRDRCCRVFKASSGLARFSSDNDEDLAKSVCGMMNGEGGVLVLEVVGDVLKIDVPAIIADLKSRLVDRVEVPIAVGTFRYFQFSPGKGKVVVVVRRSNVLQSADGSVYVAKGSEIRRATAKEIEITVAENLMRRFGARVEKPLLAMSNQLSLLSHTWADTALLVRLENDLSLSLLQAVKIDLLEPSAQLEKTNRLSRLWTACTDVNPCGIGEGSVCILPPILKIREPHHYTRFLAPLFDLPQVQLTEIGGPLVSVDSIVVSTNGASLYTGPGVVLSESTVVQLRPRENAVSPLALLAWLKSSFFVWYCAVRLGSPNPYVHLCMAPHALPVPRDGSVLFKQLEAISLAIVRMEKQFLRELSAKTQSRPGDTELLETMLSSHNRACNDKCADIDKLIASHFGLREDDVELIDDSIREMGLAVFGECN